MERAEIADAVVIGGGIMGVTLAYELTRRLTQVTLLEARGIGNGATANGFAWLNATSKTDDETYHRLNAQGLKHYNRLLTDLGTEAVGLHGGGSLLWADEQDTEASERLRARATQLQAWDYPVALLRKGEMQALEPRVQFPEAAIGLFAPADKWLETPRLLRLLTERIQQQGGEVRPHTPVQGLMLRRGADAWEVQTPSNRIVTRRLLLAGGAQTNELLALASNNPNYTAHLAIKHVPGVLVETTPGSAFDWIHRVLYPADVGGLHLRPTPSGGLLIGADDVDAALLQGGQPVLELTDGQMQVITQNLVARTLALLPGLSLPPEVLQPRLCIRPIPQDERPLVGTLPGLPQTFLAVTHSGVTLAPYLATLLVEQVLTGLVPPALTPYAPARLNPLRNA